MILCYFPCRAKYLGGGSVFGCRMIRFGDMISLRYPNTKLAARIAICAQEGVGGEERMIAVDRADRGKEAGDLCDTIA